MIRSHYIPVIYNSDCLDWLSGNDTHIDLTFLDPPFNQGHDYRHFDDSQDPSQYWAWMKDVLHATYKATSDGGTIYFMQREKNTEFVLESLRKTGWFLQNLVIWKKLASAVPCSNRFGKQYQIIAVATKGPRPRVFNRLRINPPLEANQKRERKNGIYVTDIWADIRELTSGYFAGSEPVRTESGERFHKQQSPLALLTRIILSSSLPNDIVFDPFAGTGTTLVAAMQLLRQSIGVEKDPINIDCVKSRVSSIRDSDSIHKLFAYYQFTENLDSIWGTGRESTIELLADEPARLPALI